MTCDNGIAAAAEIQMAKDKGMTVIITDHHEVPYREEKGERQMVLPPADAILNPKQYDCPYPNKNLCGAVVAFKYIAALTRDLVFRQRSWKIIMNWRLLQQ